MFTFTAIGTRRTSLSPERCSDGRPVAQTERHARDPGPSRHRQDRTGRVRRRDRRRLPVPPIGGLLRSPFGDLRCLAQERQSGHNALRLGIWNIAQFNRAVLAIALDDPRLREFLDAIGVVHAEGEASAGFVSRQQYLGFMPDNPFAADEFATMSVWRSLEDLKRFTYGGQHLAIFRRRSEWFVREPQANVVLWWIPEGHTPTLAEAFERLTFLRVNGPDRKAFGFASSHPPE